MLIRNQPARKFRQRYIGPYPVTAKISSQAYRLRWPPTFDCHNVFHINRLRKCVNPDAQPDTIPSIVEPPIDEFVVERVLDFSIERREDMFKRGLCLVFLVRWLNYNKSHDSRQPYSALRRVEALHDFARASRHLQDTLRSKNYANLRARYPSRFLESIPEREHLLLLYHASTANRHMRQAFGDANKREEFIPVLDFFRGVGMLGLRLATTLIPPQNLRR